MCDHKHLVFSWTFTPYCNDCGEEIVKIATEQGEESECDHSHAFAVVTSLHNRNIAYCPDCDRYMDYDPDTFNENDIPF